MGRSFFELFDKKNVIIGMLHLAGSNELDKDNKVFNELMIYEEGCLDGVIVEDYHGDLGDLTRALESINNLGTKLKVGVNFLRNPYHAFELASAYGASFIQVDSVQTPDLNLQRYVEMRERHPNICVLGGVRFKYTKDTGNPLEVDLNKAMTRCDAVVTTGSGTGIETPMRKLVEFKEIIGDFPLIVGAGVNNESVQKQLRVVNGAIIGSYFKGGDTRNEVDEVLVRRLMSEVR